MNRAPTTEGSGYAGADSWDRLVAIMPLLTLAWLAGASLWSARVAGLI